MKGFTKRFLTFMITVSVVSQSGIGVLAAGGSQPGLVSDPGSGAAKGTRAVPAEDTIIVDEDMEITADDSHNYKVVDGGYLEIFSPDDETEIIVSGNIEICENGMVNIWELVNVTGTITVRAGGQIGIGGTVEDVVPEQGAFIVLGENGVITNMPEGYEWASDEYGNLILVPAQDPGADYAAGIEGTENYYNTLEEALTAAAAGQTVILLKDVELEADSIVRVKTGVTLDLNGYSMTGADLLAVTGKLVDSGENRGHFAADTYTFANDALSDFPVYDASSEAYALYDLAVTTYPAAANGKYGFRLTNVPDREEAAGLIYDDDNDGRVEARICISWVADNGKVEKILTYNSDYLNMHASNPRKYALTFAITGLAAEYGHVTATPSFVVKDAGGNVMAEMEGDPWVVQE